MVKQLFRRVLVVGAITAVGVGGIPLGMSSTVHASQSDVFNVAQAQNSGLINVFDTRVAVDKYGFTYVAGTFFGTGSLTFGNKTLLEDDPTTANDNLSTQQIFIAKYSSTGFPIWVNKLYTDGISGRVDLAGITVSDSGRVYVAGNTTARIKFGFGTFTPTGCGAGFIAYLSSDDGDVDGGRLINSGTPGATCSGTLMKDIAVDKSGNVYVSGAIAENATFTKSGAPITFPNPTGYDAFVAKLSSLLDAVWVNTRASSGDAFGEGVGVDNSGNVYMSGEYSLVPEFPGTSMSLDGCSDNDECLAGFVTKYSSDGVAQWISTNGGTASNISISDFAVDGAGNSFITGTTFGIKTPNTGAGAFGSNTYQGVPTFFAKYNTSGGVDWLKTASYYSDAQPLQDASFSSVDVDRFGNVFTTLHYAGTATFGAQQLTSSSGRQVLFAKYDGRGKQMWARNITVNAGLTINQGLVAPKIVVYRDQIRLATWLRGPFASANFGALSATRTANDAASDMVIAQFEANQAIQVAARNRNAIVTWAPLVAQSDIPVSKIRVKVVGTKKRCVVDVSKTRCRFRGLSAGAQHVFTVELLDASKKVISLDRTEKVVIGVKQKTFTVSQNQPYGVKDLVQLASKGRVRMKVVSGNCTIANRQLTATGDFFTECRVQFTVKKNGSWPKMVMTFTYVIV
jgi:hypothetical protein